jgi:hypothetical protein
MTLGEQFGNLMDTRSALLVERAGFPIAEEITLEMKNLTKEGRGFDDRYDTPYRWQDDRDNSGLGVSGYALKRKRAGLQPEKVELRYKSLRIERTTQPTNVMGGAEIGFVDGGKIFKYHQDGVRYRNGDVRTRTIFPRDWASVPPDIYARFKQLIVGVLSGKS